LQIENLYPESTAAQKLAEGKTKGEGREGERKEVRRREEEHKRKGKREKKEGREEGDSFRWFFLG